MSAARRLPLLAVLAAAVLRLVVDARATVLSTPDTADYLHQAQLPVWSAAFWGSQHPPLLPLLWKALPVDAAHLLPAVLVNGALASLCWGALSLVLSSLGRGVVVRTAIAVAVLALSLAPEVTGWETAGLSESLSLSLAALTLALAIRYGREPSTPTAGALGASLLAATLTRDTMLPLTLLALAPIAVLVRRRAGVLLAFAAAAAVLSLWGQSAGHRAEIPTRNAIGMAMLQSQANAAWFHAHGLPSRPDTIRLLLMRPSARFRTDPRAAELHTWIDAHGRRTWLAFLASHPSRTTDLLERLDEVYDPPRTALASYWGGSVQGWSPHGSVLALLCVAGCAAAWARRRTRDGLVLVSFLAATLPVAFLIWDADAFEFVRHAIALPVLARVTLVTLVLVAAEPLYERAVKAAVSIPKYVGAS